MADKQEVLVEKWENFENELDSSSTNDVNQGQEFNQFIESRKNSTDNTTSIFTSSGNQERYKEFSRLDQESGYKGWSIDIRGKRKNYNFLILKKPLINFSDHFLYYYITDGETHLLPKFEFKSVLRSVKFD